MRGDGVIRVAAAAAAASGVWAIVTGSGAASFVAGLSSVACAVLVVRVGTGDVEPQGGGSDGSADGDELPTIPTPPAPDPAAGSPQLHSAEYLDTALRSRVAVAKRALRPLSVVHILILGADDDAGPVPAELMAAAAEATLRDSDLVGRRDDGVYVVILEETGEDGAVWTTERLRRHVAGTIGPRRFQAGVASYPNHGLEAETIDANAAKALLAAQEWDRDRIEVAIHG